MPAQSNEFSYAFHDFAGATRTVSTLAEARDLFNGEVAAWADMGATGSLRATAEAALNKLRAETPESWADADHRTSFLREIEQSLQKYIFSGTPAAAALLVCRNYSQHSTQAEQSFFAYLNGQVWHMNDPSVFLGCAMAARVLEIKGGFPCGEGMAKQVATWFNAMRQEESKAVEATRKIQVEFTQWKQDADTDYQAQAQKCRDLMADIEKSYDEQYRAAKEKQEGLEKAYADKLHLEGPSRYWKTRAAQLRSQGIQWTRALIVVSIISLTYFGYLLFMWAVGLPPHSDWLSLQHVKGIALNIVAISVLVFLLRTFSRMAFSSFHLQRDAEEKRQLTEVYLSLLKHKAIEPSERGMILQALFSRADTGLLTGDHSPTMPGPLKDLSLVKPS